MTASGNAGVAQLVEQLICNQQVGSSSLSTSSLKTSLLESVRTDENLLLCKVFGLMQNAAKIGTGNLPGRLYIWGSSRAVKWGRL